MPKHIKTMSEYIVKRIRIAGGWISLKAFAFMYLRPWTGVQYAVNEEAKRIGRHMLAQWLHNNRISYCARCFSTGQLRKTIIIEDERQVYLCANCFEKGKAANAVRPALDIVRP